MDKNLEEAAEICAVLNAEAFEKLGDYTAVAVEFSGTDVTVGLSLCQAGLWDEQVDSSDELTANFCRQRIVDYAKQLLKAFGPIFEEGNGG